MEGVDVKGFVDQDFWRGRRVLVTGHTGFKGSWLSLWLQSMGAQVHGFALAPPTDPNMFTVAGVADGMETTIGDVREFEAVRAAFERCRPEIIIHMAAQSLVRLSYAEPIETYATNVMGTVHILEAARRTGLTRAIVNVTTDKCYENREWLWGYREDEPMGGHDPYSSSKGCSELVTSAYRRSFFQSCGKAVASARAGNVIGGGDWALDRLVPDILRGFQRGEPVTVRNPSATRPWQHVLEPLSGYLMLAQRLYDDGQTWAEAWNFGPDDDDSVSVGWVVRQMTRKWGNGAAWQLDERAHVHEANYLKLDISKTRARLGWRPRWNLDLALGHVIDWHKAWLDGRDMRGFSASQIASYCGAHESCQS